MSYAERKTPGVLLSLTPLILLVGFMVLNVYFFKDSATSGPNQIALIFAALITSCIGVFHLKVPYEDIEKQIIKSIGLSLQAVLILMVVGSLIGIWIMSGIVPTMIYWGLKLIHPSVFLPVSCMVCSIVALSTGSSWSTTGTVGIALVAIGSTLGIPEGMVAGAIISGAYFGDKMSPLSDTTNLAPAMAGTDLITHIRHMIYTSGPAIVISLIGFSILGLFYGQGRVQLEQIDIVLDLLQNHFNLSLWLFLVPLIVVSLVIKKVPALPAMIAGLCLGIVAIPLFQTQLLESLSQSSLNFSLFFQQIMNVLVSGFKIQSGNELLDSLLSRGGMSGMLSTIWLIICAMVFGGALEGVGMLETLALGILKLVRGSGSLIGATLGSCLFTNLTASDQYIAIVLPGRMFRKAYEEYGLHPKNLSRALEDSGTVTSVLIPWNSGGAYNSSVLGVATITYLPFCFFNLLSPLVGLFLASVGWSIEKVRTNDE